MNARVDAGVGEGNLDAVNVSVNAGGGELRPIACMGASEEACAVVGECKDRLRRARRFGRKA